MKKTLMKVTMIAALALSICLGFMNKQNLSSCFAGKSFNFAKPYENSKKPKTERLFGCNEESLLAYHVGLSRLLPNYSFPDRNYLENAVRSHPAFYGTLSKQQGENLFKASALPYLIFEEKDAKNTSHFYIAHKKGLRHFKAVNALQRNDFIIAAILNGDYQFYLKEESLIRSTVHDLWIC